MSHKAPSIAVLFLMAALFAALAPTNADAGIFAKLKGKFSCKKSSCCEPAPACCEPEPVCCEPEPVCCEPKPTCCEPVAKYCDGEASSTETKAPEQEWAAESSPSEDPTPAEPAPEAPKASGEETVTTAKKWDDSKKEKWDDSDK